MDQRTDCWVDGWTNGLTVDGWTNGLTVDGCTNGLTAGWMDGLTD